MSIIKRISGQFDPFKLEFLFFYSIEAYYCLFLCKKKKKEN